MHNLLKDGLAARGNAAGQSPSTPEADWKEKRLLDDEEVLIARVSDEMLSGEGSR